MIARSHSEFLAEDDNIPLDSLLSQNLTRYTTEAEPNLFQVTREISIARYALTQLVEAYHLTIQEHKKNLRTATESHQVFATTQYIALRSEQLIQATTRVTELIQKAVSIDVDKSKLISIITVLPTLLEKALKSASLDENAVSDVMTAISEEIAFLLQSIRFSEISNPVSVGNNAGITQQDYMQMIESVPLSNTSAQQ